ncbi:ubiquitin carboxyl-terminal hydrolase 36 [Herrania umbratica]|uniref:Ubiquitin carboxyl-terminal hydrolase 36 n=1 Tax=Herrania umbratica TaxID=108875 RepID=A0A6J1ALQ0_9ROSI|nr:ubiquitin carboxyl-terminal hydrolase 36 [Herrania umbratica]
MATASFNKIERAHQMYRQGRYEEALGYYTEALAVAKTKPQKIALHSNRAACYLKLHHFKKAAEECTSVLELDHKHTGALMLRAQTLVTLKEYNSALFDVNQLIELNPSSEVYHNLQARLRTQVALAPIPESEAELEEEEEEEEEHGQPFTMENEEEQDDKKEDIVVPAFRKDPNAKLNENLVKVEIIAPEKPDLKESPEQETDYKNVPKRNPGVTAPQAPNGKDSQGWQAIPKHEGQLDEKNVPQRTEAAAPLEQGVKDSKGWQAIPKPKGQLDDKNVPQRTEAAAPLEQGVKDSKGWQAIPKPKGHSALDYARWDRVEDDSSEDDDDDDDDDESQPQYRFRVRTVGMRPVK